MHQKYIKIIVTFGFTPIWSDMSGKILRIKGRWNGSTMLLITSAGVTLSLTLVAIGMVKSVSAKLNLQW
jgi:hypothetical protein